MSELYHHGILGQKWGKQNGPPYPLKPSAHSAEEKKHFNVSARQVHKNMDSMTDQELQRAINRINMQNQVENLDKSIIDKGYDSATKNMKKFVGTVATATAVIGAWKTIGRWLK